MKRRQFLQTAALGGASGVATVGAHGWLWRSSAQAATVPRLIVVMLRGATDGLNIVVPYRENVYYQERPSIAIAKPG
ncbi:MAG: twin-arginine translocation signal domain-containing protein, partial [Cyanobacteria bacterium J06632_3]